MKAPVLLLAVSSLVICHLVGTAFAGPYYPFDRADWTLPPGFKVQRYYEGVSLGTGSEYGNLPKSRSLAVSGNSFLTGNPVITYVSTKGASSQGIYALVDLRNRGKADYATLIAKDLAKAPLGTGAPNGTGGPNGIAWVKETAAGGSLYILVSEYFVANRLLRIEDVDTYAKNKATVPAASIKRIRDDFPHDSWHGWRYIKFDSAKNLYVAIGANCNICNVWGTAVDNGWYYNRAYNTDPYNMHNIFQKNASTGQFQFATIYKLAPPYTAVSGTGFVKYATGIRNTVGFDFYPGTTNMYFTDNGADDIGGTDMNITRNLPDCELNFHPGTAGTDYGYPFCHTGASGPAADNRDLTPYRRLPGAGNNVVDPFLNINQGNKTCNGGTLTYRKAIQAMGPHVAPLGLRFYKAASTVSLTNFPADYINNALIAQRGSWDRDWAIGARVMRVKFSTAPTVSVYDPLLAGGVPGDDGSPDGPDTGVPGSNNRTIQNWRGRPVDIEYLPDSTILVSDDEMGAVYRIAYCGTGVSIGATAKLGTARCGEMDHVGTIIKLRVAAQTKTGVPSTASGCMVNLGSSNATYVKCAEYDVSARQMIAHVAYNIRRINSTLLVMDGAFVAHDYRETNGRGWVAFGIPSKGGGMDGNQVLMAIPSSNYQSASVAAYLTGNQAAGVAGFQPTVNWVASGTTPTAAMAGDALVINFSINLPSTLARSGGSLATILAYGDTDPNTGRYKQHWLMSTLSLPIVTSDVGKSVPGTAPLINPNVAPPPVYTPACVSSTLTSGTCEGNPLCLNGVNYDSAVLLNDYPSTALNFYFTLSGSTLSVGMKADVSGFGQNGYAVLSIPTGSFMTGNDCMFLRKSSTSNSQAVNLILDGYQGYSRYAPSNCTYTNIKVVESSPLNGLVSTFDIAWPASNKLKVRYGGGGYPGGTGIEGMSKHPAGSPPYFGCIYVTGGVVQMMGYPAITTLDAAAWGSTPCA